MLFFSSSFDHEIDRFSRKLTGCDKKVLISSSPENDSPMEGIQTGGKNGDGTVFSLDLHEVSFELANTRL